MQTFLKLRTSIRNQIWADHEAENLVEPHNQHFLEALSNIQKNVPCEAARNANVILFCNTFVKCFGLGGMTVVPRPRGVIKFLYTIANEDWCDPVFYRQATLQEVQCYKGDCREFINPTNEGQAPLPLGFRRAEAASDSTFGRARSGLFAIHDDNVFITPWIGSNERVVIEWAGIKTAEQWGLDDPLSDAIDFRTTVKLWMQYAHERDYGTEQAAAAFHNPGLTGSYDEALSELMLQCHEETRIRKDTACRPCPTWSQIKDDAVPT